MSFRTIFTLVLGLSLLVVFYAMSRSEIDINNLERKVVEIDSSYYYSAIEDLWMESDEMRYLFSEVDSAQSIDLLSAREGWLYYADESSWFGLNPDVKKVVFFVSEGDTLYSALKSESKG